MSVPAMRHKPMIESKKKDHFDNRRRTLAEIDHNLKPGSNTAENSSKKILVNNFKIGYQNESN